MTLCGPDGAPLSRRVGYPRDLAAEQASQQGEGWRCRCGKCAERGDLDVAFPEFQPVSIDEAYLRADELRWNRPPGCEEDTLP